jgi:hypothetical protein
MIIMVVVVVAYTKDNIQLVCCMINIMKWDLKQDDFINICKTIYIIKIDLKIKIIYLKKRCRFL